MLSSYYVEGYKGLKSVSITNLSRINLIVGKSSSGKTAFLESIKIGLTGNPSTMWHTSFTRGGIQYLPPGSNGQQFESSWRQFFSDFDPKGLMRFWLQTDNGDSAITSAFFDREQSLSIAINSGGNGPVQFVTFNPMVFDRSSFASENTRLTAKLDNSGLQFEQGSELGIPSEVLPSSGAPNIMQIANWFSSLSIEDREHEIIETICSAFPTISGLSVQSPQGYAQLYATIKTMNRKLPVTSISSGITKFISIILAMTVYQGGVLIIDEIENGIYYKSFPTLWNIIIEYSFRTDTQIFASTHSWECLKAAADAFGSAEDHKDLFSLLQVSNEFGETFIKSVNGFDAINAIEGDIEVRR